MKTNEEKVNKEQVSKKRKSRLLIEIEKITDHLPGPLLSVFIHLLAIIFLMSIIVIKAPEEYKEPVISFEEKLLKTEDIPELEPVPEITDDEIIEEDPVINEYEISYDEPESTSYENSDDAPSKKPCAYTFQSNFNLKMTNSALKISSLLISRKKGMKGKGFRKRGGSRKTLNTLYKGLRWLKDHQNPDGSWGDTRQDNFPAYTALALLAFLGAAETPSSAEFGKTVIKAIKKLLEDVSRDGNGLKGGYRHAIATYALCEAYGMTGIPMLKDTVNKCVLRIINAVNSDGSFNYSYDNTQMRSDLSVAGWNYQALKAAYSAGIEVPGLEECIDKCIETGLKKTHFCGSGFSYNKKSGPSDVMTAVGTLCLQLFGDEKSKEVTAGIRLLEADENFWFSWNGHHGKTAPWSLYKWYYQTQVIFQAHHGSGAKWKKWNRMFSGELARKQNKDGSWFSPAYKAKLKGHSENSELPGIDQPVYATSLSCLMLEVYFRYLTTFKHNKKPEEKNENETEDDIRVDIVSSI